LTPFPVARTRILERCAPLGTERVSLANLSERVFAEDLVSPLDFPHFDNSQVDGYAIRAEDAGPRRIVGTSAAGAAWEGTVEKAEAIRIYTGAPMPQGADAVAMQEDASVSGEVLTLTQPVAEGENVRYQGEEITSGTSFNLVGTLATPPLVGFAASLGLTNLAVFRRPRAAIVATGDELAEPGQPLRPGQVYASNLLALSAALELLGIETTVHLVRDEEDATRRTLAAALEEADILLTVGGVSVGDRDLVRPSLAALGVDEVFWRVAMKPGKPFYFGQREEKRVFGLPGNPVSALVTFHTLVRPALRKMLGFSNLEEDLTALLGAPIERRDLRYELVRATLKDGNATPVQNQGSHMQTGLAAAHALLHIPDGVTTFEKGQPVTVTPLRWGLG
jgi:molybdopterin molybdotransferase